MLVEVSDADVCGVERTCVIMTLVVIIAFKIFLLFIYIHKTTVADLYI